MDESTFSKIEKLAINLRDSAHLILSSDIKFTLDSWSLSEILEAFSFLFETGHYSSLFTAAVCASSHSVIANIQFLYDLLQVLKRVKIFARFDNPLPRSEIIDVSIFYNLTYLELGHLNVKHLKGLHTLRSKLQCIKLYKSLTRLKDLFVLCGADEVDEYPWENLTEAYLQHNDIRCVDNSLSLLSVLQNLNLSFCQLKDGSDLQYLLSGINIDLSYNYLSLMPVFSPAVSSTLRVLKLCNNYIASLIGLEQLVQLEELDLSCNMLSDFESLNALQSLSCLCSLMLINNPIYFNCSYRVYSVRRLSKLVKKETFLLDKAFLSASELPEVGYLVSYFNNEWTEGSCCTSHLKNSGTQTDVFVGSSKTYSRRVSKQIQSKKSRHIDLSDSDGESPTVDDTPAVVSKCEEKIEDSKVPDISREDKIDDAEVHDVSTTDRNTERGSAVSDEDSPEDYHKAKDSVNLESRANEESFSEVKSEHSSEIQSILDESSCSETSSFCRRDSDVEVITNPSLSSIEVLSEHSRTLTESVISENSIIDHPVKADVNTDARTPQSSPQYPKKAIVSENMLESNSSGSLTGSVCTAYEKSDNAQLSSTIESP